MFPKFTIGIYIFKTMSEAINGLSILLIDMWLRLDRNTPREIISTIKVYAINSVMFLFGFSNKRLCFPTSMHGPNVIIVINKRTTVIRMC